MRESIFVRQNQEKWGEIERELASSTKNPDNLRRHLIETTDDLSYARTFYRNRSVRVYLNELAQRIYINIYKNKKNFRTSLKGFFLDEIPLISWQNRKVMLVSFILLVFSVLIGAFSSAWDEQFPRAILSDGYVDHTLDNIKKGDPFGIYKNQDPFEMFLDIALNNLQVSMYVFITGILACYGSAVLMVRNGIMLGVFMYFFYSRGLATEFNFTVWMHGTIEILTLVVETTAGMLLGRGLIYPGTHTRYKALSIYGRKGALLFLSTVPFIVFAAFIESFLTRYTEMPNILRGAIIFGSLFLMVYYFVIFPYRKFRGKVDNEMKIPDLKPDTGIDFQPTGIYSNAQIFLKSIQFFSLNTGKIMRFTFIVSSVFLSLLLLFNFHATISRFELIDVNIGDFFVVVFTQNIDKFFTMYANAGLLFNPDETLKMYILSSLWTGFTVFFAVQICKKYFKSELRSFFKTLLCSLLYAFVINLLMFINHPLGVIAYVLVAGVLSVPVIHYNFIPYAPDVHGRFDHLLSGFWRMLGIIALEFLITFLGFIFILSPIAFIIIFLMEMNIELDDQLYNAVLQSILMFAFIFIVTLSILFFFIEMYFLAHTLYEIRTAAGLTKGIENIGEVHKTYGIETE